MANDNLLPASQPPAPPTGALDKGVTGADPANAPAPAAPATDLMSEATRLGGPLGGIAIGGLVGAATHPDVHNYPAVKSGVNSPAPAALSGQAPAVPTNALNKSARTGAVNPSTTTMLAPNGQIGEVPSDRVTDAVNAGFKLGVNMRASNGQTGVVPMDRVHDAIKGGMTLDTHPENQNVHAPDEGIREGGKTAGIDVPATDENEYTDPTTGLTTSQMADPRTLKMGAAATGAWTGAALAPVATELVGGGLLGSIAGGATAGGVGSATEQAAQGENPISKQTLRDATIGAVTGGVLHGAGTLVGKVAPRIKAGLSLIEDAGEQGVKDDIRGFLGGKTDADIADNAHSLMEKGKPAIFSDTPNELKLVKSKVDARLAEDTAAVNDIADGSEARVKNVAARVTHGFDDMIDKIQSSVSDTKDAEIEAVKRVRDQVVPRLNDDMSVREATDIKRNIYDQVKKFEAPENMDSPAKQAQEGYRRASLKIKDMINDAEPDVAKLNDRIHTDIKTQDLLEKKFPQLETADQAKNSYDHVRIVNAAKKLGIGVPSVAGGGLLVYNALKQLMHSIE